ncbi:MAG: sulfotransferase [Pseudomonadota bacterium]
MELAKRIIYVSGLPRSGSTLMCQLLGQHPEVYHTGHSSPLYGAISRFRQGISGDSFLLAQLDHDLERVHDRLLAAIRGLMNGWFEETERPVVVDKSRGWLKMVELLALIDPDFRMIVCVRDPRQILGSIERQHARTRLLDFPDDIDAHSISARLAALFGNGGLVGEPMKSIEQMQDIEDEAIRSRLCYVTYEQLVANPVDAMAFIYDWLGLADHTIDPSRLATFIGDADSHYRYKFTHETRQLVSATAPHQLPVRIDEALRRQCAWFFRQFYPTVELPGTDDAADQ